MTETFEPFQCDTALLRPNAVEDLDAFLAEPEEHLLSIHDDPEGAARLWAERLKRNPYGGEGVVTVEYYGHELMGPTLLDHVTLTWDLLVDAVEEFVTGASVREPADRLPEEPALRRVAAGALFSMDDQTTLVDPAVVVPGLLDGAAAFTAWVRDHLGTSDAPDLDRLDRLRAAWEQTRTSR